ncbi:MAG: DAK2 domain-containing protein [Clostridiaceae bacterium]
MEFTKIDGLVFYNMIVNAANKLEEQKEFVNSLNVFPVPDGDTGTNMSMTFKSAVDEISASFDESLGDIGIKVARGALMGARGNSGVILSQIFRGISKALIGKNEIDAKGMALAFKEGANSAYKAVMRPTEGTILTIIRAAGDKAMASPEQDITKLFKEICDYSKEVLDKTPEMLPVLKKANVVDAGGMGLLIILRGMQEALENNIQNAKFKEVKAEKEKHAILDLGEQEIKFGYCTEFFVKTPNPDVESFKNTLEKYGDSMVVVGLDDVIKVHIHTNKPGEVLSKALAIGELSKVKIDNMREQHRHILTDEAEIKLQEAPNAEKKKYGIVAVAMGEGIKNIFEDLGVDYVIEGGQTMNPSTHDILDKINLLAADNVIVLPNNGNIIMAATQAAELSDKNVIVVPTKTIPQGITAMTLFNEDSSPEENLETMEEGIEGVKSGQVTYAVRDTEIDGKEIKEGNILGLSAKSIVEVGEDIYKVCEGVLDNMVDEDSELITIFYGEDVEEDKIDKFKKDMENKYKDIDVHFYQGKQPLYYFIISVE